MSLEATCEICDEEFDMRHGNCPVCVWRVMRVDELEQELKDRCAWAALWKSTAKIWRKLSRGLDKNATHHANLSRDRLHGSRESDSKLKAIKRVAHAAEETAERLTALKTHKWEEGRYIIEPDQWANLMVACGVWEEKKSG